MGGRRVEAGTVVGCCSVMGSGLEGVNSGCGLFGTAVPLVGVGVNSCCGCTESVGSW